MIDNVALDGTEILFAISNDVPPPVADVLIPNTTFVAAEVTFAAKTDSILKTLPDEVALTNNTVFAVVDMVIPVVIPKMDTTATIFGFAIFYLLVNYYPKTNAKAIDFPAEIPALPKLKTPEPLVTIACPLVPSATGKFNVKDDETVVEARNPTY